MIMKRLFCFLLACVFIFRCLVELPACSNYEKIELTKDNFYDYFVRFESGFFDADEKIDDFTFAESDANDSALSAYFVIPDNKSGNSYFTDVIIEMKINLYYGKTSISTEDKPTTSFSCTSKLHYTEFSDGYIYYSIGVLLSFNTLDYKEKNGTNGENDGKYTIDILTADYDATEWQYSNYYREIVITSVSGVVGVGGLTGMNNYHCN